MQIHLLAVGTRMPEWVEAGFAEYTKRLPPHCKLVLREIPAGKRGKGADLDRLTREEGERLLEAVPKGACRVALDRGGKEFNTEGLAARLKQALADGRDLALMVGGPEGLSAECLAQAEERWSLSKLTLAHPLVRVVLAEQLYRAWSLLEGKPYHR